jgi:hypothetical protein
MTSPEGARHEKTWKRPLPGVRFDARGPPRFAGSLVFFAPVIQLHKKREDLGR